MDECDFFAVMHIGVPGTRYNKRLRDPRAQYLENLSKYREDAIYRGEFLVDVGLAFDIERLFSIGSSADQPVQDARYSMMIDGYHSAAEMTVAELEDRIREIPGVVENSSARCPQDGHRYTNRERNVLISTGVSSIPSFEGNRRFYLGVIQREPVTDLHMVICDILPYAVETFNSLSPSRKISRATVRRSVTLALAADMQPPRTRP